MIKTLKWIYKLGYDRGYEAGVAAEAYKHTEEYHEKELRAMFDRSSPPPQQIRK